MRSTAVRRTALAAAAASLVLLVTACGGEGSDGGTNEKGNGKGKDSAAAEPAAKALTAAELEKIALAEGDVKAHKIVKAGPQDDIAAKDVKTEKPECEPLARALAGTPMGAPVATVKRRATAEPDVKEAGKDGAIEGAFDITTSLVALSSYEGQGAADAFAAVKSAGTACAGGFTMTMAGTEQKIVKMTEAEVSGGDEAVAWTMTAEQDGEKLPFNVAVVRKGGTFVSFSSFNLMAPEGDLPLPTAVINAQAAKLG
ncbi:sensor domain-containing protein [Streptomyces pristinaespiralis]|uniref:sensor domain-containing protein n=1 Tax=Streptomyces pristinaespiralis TaxID=38300 RepID=UPI0033C11BE3